MGACVSECMDATRVVLTIIFSSLLVTRKGRERTRRVRGAGAGVHGSRDTTRHPAPHESINAHRRRGSPVEGNASPLPTTLHLPAGVSSPFAFRHRPNPKKKDCLLPFHQCRCYRNGRKKWHRELSSVYLVCPLVPCTSSGVSRMKGLKQCGARAWSAPLEVLVPESSSVSSSS